MLATVYSPSGFAKAVTKSVTSAKHAYGLLDVIVGSVLVKPSYKTSSAVIST